MNIIRKNIIYSKKSLKTLVQHPSVSTFVSFFKYYPAWFSHLAENRNSVVDKMPWMAFEVIDYLKTITRKDMSVFEYGSGGSTLFWASRVRELVSVEHDRKWFDKMKTELAEQGLTNVKYILSEADTEPDFVSKNIAVPADYISSDPSFKGKSFKNYATQIDSYANNYFDIVIVDGRARPSCIQHAKDKVKINGFLIVDNTERKHYLSQFAPDKKQWAIRTYMGPTPYSYHFSKTTVLQKKY